MVIMASGIARVRARKHGDDDNDRDDGGGVAQHGAHTRLQPWFTVCFIDIGYPSMIN